VKILLTGAGGFLGRAIATRLVQDAEGSLRCQVRQAKSAAALAAALPRGAAVETVFANLLAKADAARILAGIDVVVHAAAGMRGAPADMYLNTVVATRNLLDALANSAVRRLVLISSFAVYGTYDLPRGAVVDESSPLEAHPEWRDGYALAKLHQEELVRERMQKLGRELVVLRPGVIYGPGGSPYSNRVGANVFGWFLHLGGSNLLPLSYVDNCAEAVAVACSSPAAAAGTFNVHDNDLVSCRQYLKRFNREVGGLRPVRIPYWVLMLVSHAVERYHVWSKGQLPAAFTPYVTRSLYRGRRYDNSRLRSIGWRPLVSTDEGLQRTFEYFRSQRERR
jgi:nucleoside-diphosphate-sugar epimerase